MPRISHFPAGDESELSPEIQALYAKCREKLGFVPNVFLAYQWRPSRLAAWMNHFDAVMEPTESLPAAEREMIAVAVSMANACSYCLVAHGYSVRKLTRDPVNGDLITLDYKRAEITPRQRAMLDYARVLTMAPAEVEEADLEAAARARPERRGHLGRDRDRGDVQLHEPHGARRPGCSRTPSTTPWRAEPRPRGQPPRPGVSLRDPGVSLRELGSDPATRGQTPSGGGQTPRATTPRAPHVWARLRVGLRVGRV